MKNGRSLQEQRKALLEQIHASRAEYRRILTQGEAPQNEPLSNTDSMHLTSTDQSSAMRADPAFPHSMTMRWIMKHPYYAAAAIVGIALAIPKTVWLTGRTAGSALRRKKKTDSAPYSNPTIAAVNAQMPQQAPYGPYGPYAGNAYPQPIYIQQPSATPKRTGALAGIAAFGGTALTSIVTIATMVLRDPAKMQMAMRLYSTAYQHLKNRRAKPTQQP